MEVLLHNETDNVYLTVTCRVPYLLSCFLSHNLGIGVELTLSALDSFTLK